jgi:hypothetical protein
MNRMDAADRAACKTQRQRRAQHVVSEETLGSVVQQLKEKMGLHTFGQLTRNLSRL